MIGGRSFFVSISEPHQHRQECLCHINPAELHER